MSSTGKYIDQTATIVAAYVSHNAVAADQLPGLIARVHAALSNVSSGQVGIAAAGEALRPAVPVKRSVMPDYIICLEDGKRIQVAEAAPANAVQDVAGAISRALEPCRRLSDGGAELCEDALAARKEDGARPAAQALTGRFWQNQVLANSGLGQIAHRVRVKEQKLSPCLQSVA